MLICILVGGLYYPWMVIDFAGTYLVARTAYILAYYKQGPDARRLPVLFIMLSTLVLQIIAIIVPIRLAIEKGKAEVV